MAILNMSVFKKGFFGLGFEAQAGDNTIPTDPTDLSVEPDELFELDFTWTKSDDPDVSQDMYYNYELYKDVSGAYQLTASGMLLEDDLPTYDDTIIFHMSGYQNIGGYKFQVRGYDGEDYSDWAAIDFSVLNTAPGLPQNVTVTAAVGEDPVFSWGRAVDINEVEEQELQYEYDLLKLSSETSEYVSLQTDILEEGDLTIVEEPVVSYTITDVGGGDFRFKIRAYDGEAYSGWVQIEFNLLLGMPIDKVIKIAPLAYDSGFKVVFDGSSHASAINYERSKFDEGEDLPINRT